jgi:hypothetical protein
MNFGVQVNGGGDDKERKEGRDDAVKAAMTYLDAVVHEVLRVHPPVTEMNRVVSVVSVSVLLFLGVLPNHRPITLVLHLSTTEPTNELQTPGSNRRHHPPLLPRLAPLR